VGEFVNLSVLFALETLESLIKFSFFLFLLKPR